MNKNFRDLNEDSIETESYGELSYRVLEDSDEAEAVMIEETPSKPVRYSGLMNALLNILRGR